MRRARELAAAARQAAEPDQALAAWASLRALLHPRPRDPELTELHLDAHVEALRCAGQGELPLGRAERVYEEGTSLCRELRRGARVLDLELEFARYQLVRSFFGSASVHARRAAELAHKADREHLEATARGLGSFADLWENADPGEREPSGTSAWHLRTRAWQRAAREGPMHAAHLLADAPAPEGPPEDVVRLGVDRAHFHWLEGDAETSLAIAQRALATPSCSGSNADPNGATAAAWGVVCASALDLDDLGLAIEAARETEKRTQHARLDESGWLPVRELAATAFAAAGDRDAALERLRTGSNARRADPHAAIHYHRARAFAHLDDDAAARAGLEKGIRRARSAWLSRAWSGRLARLAQTLATGTD
ncbi:MAG: hypothetical protein AAF430_20020 [Myxococcota bacterium]